MSLAATKTSGRATFASEAEMVDQFVGVLAKPRSGFGRLEITLEWDHRAGFVDVLARDRSSALIAFEAKLGDWKRAFMQAYRNTAYANRAYVLLPTGVAHRAMLHRETFEGKGIGLCCFDGKRIEVLLEAVDQEPVVTWIRRKAHEHFNGLGHESGSRARRGSCAVLSAARA